VWKIYGNYLNGGFGRIGGIPTPAPAEKIFNTGYDTMVLCGDKWYWLYNPAIETMREHMPKLEEAETLPENVSRILHIDGHSFLYILNNNTIKITYPLSYEIQMPGPVVDAIIVAGNRLIAATQDCGIILYFPIRAYKNANRITIAKGYEPRCLLFDASRLFVGDANGVLHCYNPPDSWTENSIWQEATNLTLPKPIRKIHPIQLGLRRAYIVSCETDTLQLVGFDDNNKLILGGPLGSRYDTFRPPPGPCDKFLNYRDIVLGLQADGCLCFIVPELNKIAPPEIPPPQKNISQDMTSTEQRQTFNYANIPSANLPTPLKEFDAGFDVLRLEMLGNHKLCCCGNGLAIYDITDHIKPVLDKNYNLAGANSGAFLSMSPGLFAIGFQRDWFKIFDLNSTADIYPQIVSQIDLPQDFLFVSAYEAEGILFIFSNKNCIIYDVIDPYHPRELGAIEESCPSSNGMNEYIGYYNGLFYLLNYDRIFEINPLAEGGANVVRTFNWGITRPTSIIIEYGYIYNPANPQYTRIRQITDEGWVDVDANLPQFNTVMGSRRLPYRWLQVNSLYDTTILDLSDTPNLRLVAKFYRTDTVWDIQVEGDYMYCALGTKGVGVYNWNEVKKPITTK
jgi:hypothetical protein